MSDDPKSYRRANKAAWDASAPSHGTGPDWERLLSDAAKPGFCALDETLTTVLKGLDLEGATAVQVCCNNARDLLSLASLGIVPMLGIDQSPAFLALGAQLSEASGQSPKLVEADVYDLPDSLGEYDLALITIGVINWMPDLPDFFRSVASLLKPGGKLVIYETHPVLEMFEPGSDDPFAMVYSYFEDDPVEVPELIVYDDRAEEPSGVIGYWFVHTLGEIVTACISAGLVVENLTEYPHSNREPIYDKYEEREAQLPMCYSLVAYRAHGWRSGNADRCVKSRGSATDRVLVPVASPPPGLRPSVSNEDLDRRQSRGRCAVDMCALILHARSTVAPSSGTSASIMRDGKAEPVQ